MEGETILLERSTFSGLRGGGGSASSETTHEGSGVKRKHPHDEGFSEMPPTFFITLAKESPRGGICESDDDATFDSFHERETDVCRDTSDTDSDGTIAVLEYEVATDCSSSGNNLYSDESSSGTEHEVVIAAVTTWMTTDVDDSSSGSDFAIFADTEASEGSATDPELRRADYWECVKCKNKQNNPLYRYCERCYQIRKNHFPPRPKRRKKRSKRKKTKERHPGLRDRRFRSTSASEQEAMTVVRKDGGKPKCQSHETNEVDGKGRNKERRCNLTESTCGGANSAGETPGSGEEEEELVIEGPSKGRGVTRSRVGSASSEDGGRDGGTNVGVHSNSSLGNRKRRLSRVSQDLLVEEDEEEEEDEENGALAFKRARLGRIDNKFFKNVIERLGGQSDESGVQSCVSSQEFSPTSSLTTILSSQQDSQETFCDELELERAKATISQLGEAWKSPKEVDERENLGLCIMCLEEPKNGVFVHSRFLHLCCCYKCAVKVWNKHKRCPICNSKVKNVLKLFVH
ncbi:E3 ubiquitin-protein ligase Mdm2-like [Lutzomyia longipalpis]|uniref:E3 ubiquitin-protein ligase Mdm2-like n=1 Tax=Lutzomyia longipalpis TaxID=7200 RepID=UPI00248441A7|nr:E3 ubiquitin-protein ligase Mdm2-like [Lutzomyia longipalpis]